MRRTRTGNTSHHHKCLKEYLCENWTHYNEYKIFPINLRFRHLLEYNTQNTFFYILEIAPVRKEIMTKGQTNIAFTWIQNNIVNKKQLQSPSPIKQNGLWGVAILDWFSLVYWDMFLIMLQRIEIISDLEPTWLCSLFVLTLKQWTDLQLVVLSLWQG